MGQLGVMEERGVAVAGAGLGEAAEVAAAAAASMDWTSRQENGAGAMDVEVGTETLFRWLQAAVLIVFGREMGKREQEQGGMVGC